MVEDNKKNIDLLSESINNARQNLQPKKQEKLEASRAFRIVSDMVAGVIIGFIIGYNLDAYFDSFPLFFLTCFAFGVAGSAMNIYRSFSSKS